MVEQALNTVKLQAYSWISTAISDSGAATQTLRKQVKPGITLYELLAELADQFPEFRKQVFNPETGQLSDQVMIIFNSRLVQVDGLKTTIINDKDSIALSPVLVGG
jgi:molybdopterin converting factor small subunit